MLKIVYNEERDGVDIQLGNDNDISLLCHACDAAIINIRRENKTISDFYGLDSYDIDRAGVHYVFEISSLLSYYGSLRGALSGYTGEFNIAETTIKDPPIINEAYLMLQEEEE